MTLEKNLSLTPTNQSIQAIRRIHPVDHISITGAGSSNYFDKLVMNIDWDKYWESQNKNKLNNLFAKHK